MIPEQNTDQTVTIDQLRSIVTRGLRRAPIPYESDSVDVLTLSSCERALDVLVELALRAFPATTPEETPATPAEAAADLVREADAKAAGNGAKKPAKRPTKRPTGFGRT